MLDTYLVSPSMKYEMQYTKNTRMPHYIWLQFALYKPRFFAGYSDPQSFAQR